MKEIKDWEGYHYLLIENNFVQVFVKINNVMYVYNSDILSADEGGYFSISYSFEKIQNHKKVNVFKEKIFSLVLDSTKEIILKPRSTIEVSFKINRVIQPDYINIKVPEKYRLYLYLHYKKHKRRWK